LWDTTNIENKMKKEKDYSKEEKSLEEGQEKRDNRK
jgi:hypothetical protein